MSFNACTTMKDGIPDHICRSQILSEIANDISPWSKIRVGNELEIKPLCQATLIEQLIRFDVANHKQIQTMEDHRDSDSTNANMPISSS